MAFDSPQRQTGQFECRVSPPVIVYLLEFVCRHSRCALMQKVLGSAPYFPFRLYSPGMSPVKNPGEIPHILFSGDCHKVSNPRTNRGIHSM